MLWNMEYAVMIVEKNLHVKIWLAYTTLQPIVIIHFDNY